MANYNNEQKFYLQQQKMKKDLDLRIASDNLPTANIIVAGITGVGKSTLLNAVFGSEMAATGCGKPITKTIEEYHHEDIPIHIWDTVGLELDLEKTRESIRSIKNVITAKAESKDPYDRIHAIWYCINSAGSKYQEAELDFIKELHHSGIPFIIVMTKCFADEDEFESQIRKINLSMGMDDIRIVQVLAAPVKLRGMTEDIPAFGLDTLVNVTLEMLPDYIKRGFIAAQIISQKEKRDQCEEIIFEYVQAAKNGYWDHVPIINVFITDDRIVKMFRKLAGMYNTVLSQESIGKALSHSSVDIGNLFWGLISPFDMGYSKKIAILLDQKRENGFSVNVGKLSNNDRAAGMIAFYGYTFIDSIEELWKKLTETQLKDVDKVVDKLIRIINRKLKKRMEKLSK